MKHFAGSMSLHRCLRLCFFSRRRENLVVSVIQVQLRFCRDLLCRPQHLRLHAKLPAAVCRLSGMRIHSSVRNAERLCLHQPDVPVDSGAGIPAGIRALEGHADHQLILPFQKHSGQLQGKPRIAVLPFTDLRTIQIDHAVHVDSVENQEGSARVIFL